jgi:hypothetical protein
MVTKMSAERIGHHIRHIDHLPCDTDHRGLVRFNYRHDTKYLSVLGKLKEMAAKAPQNLQTLAPSRYTTGTMIAITMFLTIAVLILAVGLGSKNYIPNIGHLLLHNDHRAKVELSQSDVSVIEKFQNMAERTQHTAEEVKPGSMHIMQIYFLKNKTLKCSSCTNFDEVWDTSHDGPLPSRS